MADATIKVEVFTAKVDSDEQFNVNVEATYDPEHDTVHYVIRTDAPLASDSATAAGELYLFFNGLAELVAQADETNTH